MIIDLQTGLAASFLMLGVAAMASCGGPDVGTASSGLTCVDDSPDCVSRRQRSLRYLIEDKDRTWVTAHAPAEAYASGVRLFALQSKRKELSCEELAHARNEADKAPHVLRGSGAGLTPAQISRGIMLASEVSRDLAAEMKRRCRT